MDRIFNRKNPEECKSFIARGTPGTVSLIAWSWQKTNSVIISVF